MYDDGLRIEKGSGGIHEEEFQVAASGEEMETVRIQVPEKETEEEEAPAETEEAEEESRERRIREIDRKRKDYYQYYTGAQWGRAQNYNLCVESGLVGVEGCLRAVQYW